MGKRNLKEGLKDLLGLVGEPVKLSEVERDKFRAVIEQFKELLDDNLEVILELDRDNAYRYLNLLIQAFQQADANYIAGVEMPAQIEPKEEEKVTQDRPVEKEAGVITPALIRIGEAPDFHGILNALTDAERGAAKARLDCVKSGLELEELGEGPDQILCNDAERQCSVEEMRKCLRTVDPSIDTNQDIIDEVNEARASGELPPRR